MISKELVEAYCTALRDYQRGGETARRDEVIEDSARDALLRDWLNSANTHNSATFRLIEDYFYDVPQIEVEMSDAQRTAMFERLVGQWRALGEADPYWSVLTHDEYRTVNLNDETLKSFFDSGADHARLVELFCQRSNVDAPRGTCVELGCGVGRVTKHLADRFEKVIAVDISAGNLRECQAMIDRSHLTNVECLLLSSPEQVADLESFDFLYSVIVLQHNQPPIQKYFLNVLLSKLNPGGAFLFQAQTHHPGYRFTVDGYLASAADPMDMHSLPMPVILELIENQGCRIREVMEDFWTGRLGSHTFFGLARPRRRRLLSSIFK